MRYEQHTTHTLYVSLTQFLAMRYCCLHVTEFNDMNEGAASKWAQPGLLNSQATKTIQTVQLNLNKRHYHWSTSNKLNTQKNHLKYHPAVMAYGSIVVVVVGVFAQQ